MAEYVQRGLAQYTFKGVLVALTSAPRFHMHFTPTGSS
jgi:hypothetical protein